MPCAPMANPSSLCWIKNPFDHRGHCSGRLALYLPRVVDIELDYLAWRGRRRHQGHALRRVKAMPVALRNDSKHSRSERERSGAVLAHDFQGRGAVEDVDQLV